MANKHGNPIFVNGILQIFQDARTQTLNDLIEQNHATYGLLYNSVMQNHTQHILLASYQLGSSTNDLKHLYTAECNDLVPWGDRPSGRIAVEDDLAAHFGDLDYERDFVAFFEQQPAQHDGQWQTVLAYHLWNSSAPLMTSLVGGFGHPLLLLADAIELGSGTLAMDALALAAVDHSGLSALVAVREEEVVSEDEDKSADAISLAHFIESVRTDFTFDGVVQHIGIQEVRAVLADKDAREAVLAHLNRLQHHHLDTADARDALLGQFVDLALDLIAATSVPGQPAAFDFYLTHVLSFCNCVRILLPALTQLNDNDKDETSLVLFRMLCLLTILPYITQQRPVITHSLLDDEHAPVMRTWEEIRQSVVSPAGDERVTDPHFVKMMQLLSSSLTYWPALEDKCLRVANKALLEFHGWRGFGKPGEAALNTASST
ncbi:hypothetical protein SBRCBS47491_000212 [Sporothrix bragantina]|uniref:Uncharacterized protein n=1 Tax=Sporothrix bragantina TaxID=671064 RepID=A0ABP0ANH1_9PEZI